MYQLYSVPKAFEEHLESRLQNFSHSLKQPQKLAESIRKLSNIFLKGLLHAETANDYWADPNLRAAYIGYFSVLNFVRAQSVFSEARRRRFLTSCKSVADWGCGGGAATWALFTEIPESHHFDFTGIDKSPNALDEYKQWSKFLGIESETKNYPLSKIKEVKADTLLLSYVLNEVSDWPEIPLSVKRLIVIEPSTHQAGREMQKWRDAMLEKGWFAWAPCTHQRHCPLIAQSGKDWCHHRVHWNKPDWFQELEKFLPMRNDTLTLSYVLLARTEPLQNLEGIARVIGDEQEEKGKTRQLVCRGPYREFMSWLHRDQISLKLHRGDLLKISEMAELRASEIRILDSSSVDKISTE